MIKTMIYLADAKPIAVLLRGNHAADEGKIRRAAGPRQLDLGRCGAGSETTTGAPVGSPGPWA